MDALPEDEDVFQDDPYDRVDELLSLFFDGELDESQAHELSLMLTDDASVRTRSVEMMRLHADLYAHFRARAKAPANPGSVVDLGLPVEGGYLPI